VCSQTVRTVVRILIKTTHCVFLSIIVPGLGVRIRVTLRVTLTPFVSIIVPPDLECNAQTERLLDWIL